MFQGRRKGTKKVSTILNCLGNGEEETNGFGDHSEDQSQHKVNNIHITIRNLILRVGSSDQGLMGPETELFE